MQDDLTFDFQPLVQNGIVSEPLFVPNGLLKSNTSILPEQDAQVLEDDDSHRNNSQISTGQSFTPNGLLNDSVSQISREATQPLPNASQILRSSVKNTFYTFPTAATASRIFSPPLPLLSPPLKATDLNGKPVFIMHRRRTRSPLETSIKPSNMLEVPVHKLMEQLSSVTAVRLTTQEVECGFHQSSRSKAPEGRLWVDRYRPQRFVDLLGDERVHRETLAWVKEWDYCVFGKRHPKGRKRGLHGVSVFDLPYSLYIFLSDTGKTQEHESEDEYHRPREKILLLSGPPGLGKTTLAHVIAAQAGYEVVEINARLVLYHVSFGNSYSVIYSDARSAQVVDDRVRPALESGSTVGSKKPVLFIVDEIDGATGGGDNTSGFVQRLLQLTFDKPKVKGKGRNKKEQARPLLRPIIAICNDLYASSLSRLRQHARIIRFNRPPDIHLVKRLREICEAEGLQADSRALTALASVAQGDMRGCLNTLQFIKSKTKSVTEPVVRATTAGMKTADTSLLTILNDLFTPLSRRRVLEMALSEAQESRFVARLNQDLNASGTLDKVAIGCFEHFLTVSTHEPTLKRHEKAYEWLTCYDMFSGTMRSGGDYALLPYLSFTLIPFYSLFAGKGGPKVERPKLDWEHFNLTKSNEEIATALLKAITGANTTTGGHAGYRHLTMGPVLSLEFLPYLNRIISPPLRPVNSQIVKPEEKAAMSRSVDIMVALELQFVQERVEDGSLVYRLEPPIDVFITYGGKRATDVPLSRYAVRQMVAAEINMALVAKRAETIDKGVASRVDFFRNKRKEEGNSNGTLGTIYTEKSQERNIDPADKPPTDFFGRPIVIPEHVTPDFQPRTKMCKVTYNFKEGNSSAVRKPVKVQAFL